MDNTDYSIEEIESVELLGYSDNEMAFDLEVDGTHMFVANDILVHNSIYVEFGRICRHCGIPADKQAKFCVDLWDYAIGPYMNQCYDEYAKKFNCPKNLQNLELEKLSDVTMYFAKKRYAMSECWKEPDIYLPYMSKVIYKGIEIVKGSTSSYARECMDDFCRFILHWYGEHDEPVAYEEVMKKLKGYKKIFMTKAPEEICSGSSVGDYEKFILNDKTQLTIGEKCPAHVQAAGIYNFILNKPKNKKYKAKYSQIRTADKIKWYYTKDPDLKVFGFLPGQYPGEFALPMDREVQFEKTILSFCNKVVGDILGYPTLTSSLCYSQALF